MIEIERKFLVSQSKWQPVGAGTKIKQGYLSVDPERVVRVRLSGPLAYLTIKGPAKGIARTELEYKIPLDDAEILIKMCVGYPVVKTRYIERIGKNVWEIDVFEEENKGLVLAEIELDDENQIVDLPAWVEEEVSENQRFFNSFLSQNPFTLW